MAGLRGVFSPPSEIALVNGTPKTVIQLLAPANHRVLVRRWTVSFDGVTVTDEPILVELMKQTTTGTMTAGTERKIGDFTEALQTQATYNATAEPTASDVYDVVEIHNQTLWSVIFPLTLEIPVPGGTRIGLKISLPSGATNLNCMPLIEWEE